MLSSLLPHVLLVILIVTACGTGTTVDRSPLST